ncbi:MAG: ACT domain-containing protein, partial [Candidatus Omnitrophica bacterium]|nr:ACT domain-containing protein [Candidatus Omnitrophota bacterium]
EDNALFVKGDMVGNSMGYGKGAGRYPTASSVMADIIDIAGNPNIFEINKAMYERVQGKPSYEIAKIGDLFTRYYVRFATVDQTGVLARIASVLAKHNISISTVIQTPKTVSKEVTVVMLIHKAKEQNMVNALKEINKLKVSKKKPVMIRIED